MIEITAEQAIEALRKVVAGNEEFVYELKSDADRADQGVNKNDGSCFYEWDGKPSCIVGHVLAELGASIGVLRHLDTRQTAGIKASRQALSEQNIFTTSAAIDILHVAQYVQDRGSSWGEALADAEQVFANA